jgi:disulfide oxidoreductase YuzD
VIEMAKKEKTEIHWLNKPQDLDYPAASSYLSLIYDDKSATSFVLKLKDAALVEFKAKDIFRASNLSLLGVSNLHVRRDIKKIKSGELMSPLLLVREQANGKLTIADGYHRLCAAYHFDEDALIPCKIV